MRRRWLAVVSTLASWGMVWGQTVDSGSVTVQFYGDVNLGRRVGQRILREGPGYPFANIRGRLAEANFVFVNLESQLSDQQGRTVHPRYNMIFCGPPEGATALREANIGLVSTSNNHAFDFRFKGLRETIAYLSAASVAFHGTSVDPQEHVPPTVVERNGIRLALVAYTTSVNIAGAPKGSISMFDTGRVRSDIIRARTLADLVIASYHGGEEYADHPDPASLRDMRFLIEADADLVVGHHPHVPYGVERYQGRWILPSLGNMVFYQPQHYWTQRSYGVACEVVREGTGVGIRTLAVIPIRAGYQPAEDLTPAERDSLYARVAALSNVPIDTTGGTWRVVIPSLP